MPGIQTGQTRASLELESHTVESYHLCTGIKSGSSGRAANAVLHYTGKLPFASVTTL